MDWWKCFFTEDYLRQYEARYLTRARTRKETRAILKILRPAAGARILDLACGQGRISIELAKKGYRVTGVDYSKYLLSVARKRAGSRKIDFIRKDMRKIGFREEFDIVINWFTAFGYFSDKDNESVLRKVHKALKKNGKFLLDLSHDTPGHGHMPSQGWSDHGDYVVLETRRYNPKRKTVSVKRDFIFIKSGKRRTYEFRIRTYSWPELRKLLKKTGFKLLKVFGGFDLSRFTKNSGRIIVLAQKEN
ncbi:MAG: class I SAM-dependent methyltransferase [Elusimicrobiota bacterium]